MFKIEKGDINYLAKIVRLSGLRKHSNADRLQCVNVDGNNVITDLSAKDGDICVFFPVECQINKDFLSWSNSFEDKELNNDKEKRGFFNKHGRVRAIRLRGERSEGYIIPAEHLFEWLGIKSGVRLAIDLVDTEFDTYNDTLICEKYIPKKKQSGGPNKQQKKARRESKLVDGQFRLSVDTAHLKRNLERFSPEDVITVSYKMHGCNTSLGKVLCKRKLSLLEKVAKFVGVKVQESEYDLVFASRRVIKNQYADKKHNSFYEEDVWSIVADRYKNAIKDGITLYGEIVGQLPNGKWIQKNFDYGMPNNYCDLFVYRMTYTSPSGDVFEFTTPQMKRYCDSHGLKTVPIFFHGKANDLVHNLFKRADVNNEAWRERFLNFLIDNYTEKDCFMCKNSVPEEGVVITREQDVFEPFKLKSFRFLEHESKELDSGEENIDDQ